MAVDIVRRARLCVNRRYERLALLNAARAYMRHGWPVIPGAWWSLQECRHVCDIPGCRSGGLHPGALDTGPVSPLNPPSNLADYALTSEQDIRTRWGLHPYSVLMPTGITCDVIELPSITAHRIWAEGSIAALHAPAAQLEASPGSAETKSSGDDAVMFVVTQTGETIPSDTLDELARNRIVLHRNGSWVPLPPTSVGGRPMRWLLKPQQCGWQLLPLAQLSQHILRRIAQLRSVPPPTESQDEAA